MHNIYVKTVEQFSSVANPVERLTFLNSVLRSVLQVAAISAIEVVAKNAPEEEIDITGYVARLCAPTDGLPIEILDKIIPTLRTYVDRNIGLGWFHDNGTLETPLFKVLSDWVQFRNSRAGHGVIDTALAQEWAPKVESAVTLCLDSLSSLIPYVAKNCDLVVFEGNLAQKLSIPLVHHNKAIVLLRATCNIGVWKLKGQLLSVENAEEFVVNLDESCVFSLREAKSSEKYELSEITIDGVEASFYQNVPSRQTDTFEGRKKELQKLEEWINDQDSRMCLVYGDGGYGKTTLVLEFINRFIEDKVELKEPLPTIVTFHTAKMTKWTDGGLEHLRGVSVMMDECVRELIKFFLPNLSKDWYQVDGDRLLQKAVTFLKSEGLERDDVLLIFDNTETLATSTDEVESLVDFLQSVSKKIGRILITSRRREFINATPVPVRELEEFECINLMKRLAKAYNATPIIQAGEARLRSISKQLMSKPLLINALVKYISHSQVSIDNAMESIFKKSNEELLEFLYEDAWVRMSELQRDVCMILVSISTSLDQVTVGKACQEMGIPLAEFHKAIDETYFASVTSYGEQFSMELVELASRFFEQKFKSLPKDKLSKLKLIVEAVDLAAIEHQRVEDEYKEDRVADAFRGYFAKLAKISASNGDTPKALEMYELAITEEPLNSALHDRYAWFVFHKTPNTKKAQALWERSIELNPDNCDALVNLAILSYREDYLTVGDQFIDRARKLSRTYSFCLLNKGKARYYYWKRNKAKSDAFNALLDASMLVNDGLKALNRDETYYSKTNEELLKFKVEINDAIKLVRTKS